MIVKQLTENAALGDALFLGQRPIPERVPFKYHVTVAAVQGGTVGGPTRACGPGQNGD